MRKRESIIIFQAFLVSMGTQDIVVMIFGVRPVISPTSMHITLTSAYCNVSFYLEMDSDYVISKSEGHLAPPFLHFCEKYDI